MCGRFAQKLPSHMLLDMYRIIPFESNTAPNYNVAPTDPAIVVRANRDKTARAPGVLDLRGHKLQRGLNRLKAFGRHETPQQSGARVPILNPCRRVGEGFLQRDSRLHRGPAGKDHGHATRD